MSIDHRSKRRSHQVLVRQAEMCSVNVTLDFKVKYENWCHYLILFILLLLWYFYLLICFTVSK